eukprot:1386506-Prymnesium_polylepis.1
MRQFPRSERASQWLRGYVSPQHRPAVEGGRVEVGWGMLLALDYDAHGVHLLELLLALLLLVNGVPR